MKTEKTTKERVFDLFCRNAADIMCGIDTIRTENIAEQLGLSVYQTRKALRELRQSGMLVQADESGYNDYTGETFHVRGHKMTAIAYQTKAYKDALWKQAQECSKLFGQGTPEQWYKAWNRSNDTTVPPDGAMPQ